MIEQIFEQELTRDELAIHNLLKQVVMALNASDVEALLSLHSDDIILMENNMPLIQGKQQVRQFFADYNKKEQEYKIALQVHEIEIACGWAFTRGAGLITKIEADKCARHSKGKFIFLFKKQDDGRWLRTHVIVNTDEP